jgi:teichuronic acid biosynthesis glycosyltransferase TuaG
MTSLPANQPLVSVIMPAYNAEETICESIESLIAQNWLHWELILVVDCKSSDDTLSLAQEYASKEPRIRIVSDLPCGGCSYNRNQAILSAGGAFIAFLDSDDVWLPEKLARQVGFMEITGCDFSYTGYSHMDWTGKPLPRVIRPPARLTYDDLLHDNLIGCLTAMIRKSSFPKIEFVDFLHEDYILWLSLLKKTSAQGLSEPLAVYRVAPNSRSGNKLRAAWKRWCILRDFEGVRLVRALSLFFNYAFRALIKRAQA